MDTTTLLIILLVVLLLGRLLVRPWALVLKFSRGPGPSWEAASSTGLARASTPTLGDKIWASRCPAPAWRRPRPSSSTDSG